MKKLPINQIICGDCLEVMKQMPNECVDMIMTSPPYWGLRDYGIEQIFGRDKDCEHEWNNIIKHRTAGGPQIPQTKWQKNESLASAQRDTISNICIKCGAWKGQLGLEPTPEMYIEHLTEIFNEAKRVLKKEGTLWLNMGDTYGGSGGAGGDYNIGGLREEQPKYKQPLKIMPKCLLMIPERLSWSLIQNGWILRNKIIWHKSNCMPSSAKDRFTVDFEPLFFFSKNRKYYFDQQLESYDWPLNRWGGEQQRSKTKKKTIYEKNMKLGKTSKLIEGSVRPNPKGRNPRCVWTIPTQSFPEAHFAIFPEKLCEKPIKAGCPEQICKKCGKARERIVERTGYPDPENNIDNQGRRKSSGHIATDTGRRKVLSGKKHAEFKAMNPDKTIGWTSCKCNAGFEGGIVLDPFVGAGTVGVVAKKLGRQFILIDIKKEYCEMAEKRITQVGYQMELRI